MILLILPCNIVNMLVLVITSVMDNNRVHARMAKYSIGATNFKSADMLRPDIRGITRYH